MLYHDKIKGQIDFIYLSLSICYKMFFKLKLLSIKVVTLEVSCLLQA